MLRDKRLSDKCASLYECAPDVCRCPQLPKYRELRSQAEIFVDAAERVRILRYAVNLRVSRPSAIFSQGAHGRFRHPAPTGRMPRPRDRQGRICALTRPDTLLRFDQGFAPDDGNIPTPTPKISSPGISAYRPPSTRSASCSAGHSVPSTAVIGRFLWPRSSRALRPYRTDRKW